MEMDDDLTCEQGEMLTQDEHLALLEEATPPAEPAPSESRSPDIPAPEDGAHRSLKLVLTLERGSEPGYQALLAVGSPDCDPVYRSLAVDGVAAALAVVPALLADAEA